MAMFEVVKNPNISNIIGLLKKPDSSIAIGDLFIDGMQVGSENSASFFEKAHDHDTKLAFIDKEDTEDIFKLLTDEDYVVELSAMSEKALVAVYNFGDKDLILWMETSGFVIGSEFKLDHDYLDVFVDVPHFYPTMTVIEDNQSALNISLNQNQDIKDALVQILI